MGSLVEVIKTTEIKDGTMKAVSVNEHELLIARVGDRYYAAENRCPHMGGKLSQGELEGTVVTCPLHSSRFDLKTGEVVRWLKGRGLLSKVGKALKPPSPLTIYNVEVEDEWGMIEI